MNIELRHLCKRYGRGVTALSDVSMSVSPGELLAVVGPSGSGKTTLLRILAGLEDPTSGEIWLGNCPATTLPPWERDVAFVFQRYQLYPHLTVLQNLEFSARRARARKRFERDHPVTTVLDELGLSGLSGRFPHQLSGGQQQRVALGKALVRRASLYLLDEPLSQLDGSLRGDMRRHLHLLHRQSGATMVYVTHDQLDALTLGDRLAVLDNGRLRQVGTPTEVYRRPTDRFVASFIGWPAANFVDAQFAPRAEGPWLQAGGWSWPLSHDIMGLWRRLAGQPITLGLRPETIHLSAALAGTDPEWRVELIESTGAGCLVSVGGGGVRLSALAMGRVAWSIGQSVQLRWDMGEAHFFDAQTGRLLTGDAPDG